MRVTVPSYEIEALVDAIEGATSLSVDWDATDALVAAGDGRKLASFRDEGGVEVVAVLDETAPAGERAVILGSADGLPYSEGGR